MAMWTATLPIVHAEDQPRTLPKVVELTQLRASGVISAWLDNGVRVHIRPMPGSSEPVHLTLSFAGAELLESAEPWGWGGARGISQVAAASWAGVLRRDLASAPTPEVRALPVSVLTSTDAMLVELSGEPEVLALAAHRLASTIARPHPLDTDIADAQALVQKAIAGRDRGGTGITSGGRPAAGGIAAALADVIFPIGDPRMRPPLRASVDALTGEAVRQWLQRHTGPAETGLAPVELGIAGAISVNDGLALARTLSESLVIRPRINRRSLLEARTLVPPQGPLERTVRLATSQQATQQQATQQPTNNQPANNQQATSNTAGQAPEPPLAPGSAAIVVGFLGVDASRPAEFRSIRAASRVLDRRVAKRLIDAGITQSPESSRSSLVFSPYPGFGLMTIQALVPLAQSQAATTVLRDEVDRMVLEGPAPEELDAIRAQLAAEAAAGDASPRAWARLLARSTITGTDPERLVGGEAFYQSLAAERIQKVLRELWTQERRVGLVIEFPEE